MYVCQSSLEEKWDTNALTKFQISECFQHLVSLTVD